MTMPALEGQIQQLFSFAELYRLQRLEDARVGFTFKEDELYLRLFGEAMTRIDEGIAAETSPALLRCAQAFERFAGTSFKGINRRAAALLSSALYWLAGYTANARVLAGALGMPRQGWVGPDGALTALLAGAPFHGIPRTGTPLLDAVRRYVRLGNSMDLDLALAEARRMAHTALHTAKSSDFAAAHLLEAVLRRLATVSLWGSLGELPTAPRAAWRKYAASQMDARRAVVDLWPSQRTAIRRGLLDGHSSVVLKMPTSAGKTKMTELAFVNDLFTGPRRCLYLAPFRALVSEIEASLGGSLSRLGLAVASLYGSSDANELEVELSQRARVVIATPEKMAAVLRLSGGSLDQFDIIVVDEGHLLGTRSRGAAFELQLASLRAGLALVDGAGHVPTTPSSDAIELPGEAQGHNVSPPPRIIFLSAVLPNAAEIAHWLGGGLESLAEENWHPTTTRVGVLRWFDNAPPRLEFRGDSSAGDETFFVPRLFEQDEWRELNPATRRFRTFRFPVRKDQGSIAAAMAFQYAAHGPVIVYTQQPRWAMSLAESVLERISHTERPITTNLIDARNVEGVRELAEFVERRLGAGSILARAAREGVGLHYGTVPQGIRLVIEEAYREGVLRLLIATNTIAQGVNFPARTVILHSLPHGDAPVRDFWNLAGRAGRAIKETQGDVIVLQTGSLSSGRLGTFLSPDRLEPARSQILEFVEQILGNYPAVSEETVRLLLESENGKEWEPAVRSIDTTLLEIMTEDLAGANEERFSALVEALLATQQAQGRSTPTGEPLPAAVRSFLGLRRDRIVARVPSVATRRRFARTGLSAASAEVLDAHVAALRVAFPPDRELSESAFAEIATAACRAPELSALNPELVATLGYTWITTGHFPTVLQRAGASLATLDEAVSYVEEVLSYQLTWSITGLLRLLSDSTEGEAAGHEAAVDGPVGASDSLPEWLRLLPQFLRYGVAERELVWAMSLGLQDRDFAAWIVRRYADTTNGPPSSFRTLLTWILEQRERLEAEASGTWPRYLVRFLTRAMNRYEAVNRALAATAEF